MIGLDTAKSVFEVHAVDEAGKVAIRRKLRRSKLIAFFEKQIEALALSTDLSIRQFQAKLAAGSSAESPNAPALHTNRACRSFSGVSSTNPSMSAS